MVDPRRPVHDPASDPGNARGNVRVRRPTIHDNVWNGRRPRAQRRAKRSGKAPYAGLCMWPSPDWKRDRSWGSPRVPKEKERCGMPLKNVRARPLLHHGDFFRRHAIASDIPYGPGQCQQRFETGLTIPPEKPPNRGWPVLPPSAPALKIATARGQLRFRLVDRHTRHRRQPLLFNQWLLS